MKKTLCYFTLPLLLLLSGSSVNSAPPTQREGGDTGTRERLAVASGSVVMDLDLDRLVRSGSSAAKRDTVQFDVGPNSFFTILRFNGVLRGAEPGSIGLLWGKSRMLPGLLNASADQLVLERRAPDERFELVVRDGKTGFVFFNIEGNLYEYDAATRLLRIDHGRLLISEELAKTLERPGDVDSVVGRISVATTMDPIEVTTFANGAATSSTLPGRKRGAPNAPSLVAGPDIIVGDMGNDGGLVQQGSAVGQVGLAMGTTSCNNGDQDYNFLQLPNPDHSVVSQNLYRMSGGVANDERFEQIGQAWVKHTFGANQDDACSLGCDPYPNATKLGPGCSDPYAASQNGAQGNQVGALGSRAWVNPFTGAFSTNPRPENHTGHIHTPTSHRILVNASDLNTATNPGATYYAEVQYDSPQEYAWCQTHPGECNMYNNASYRRYNVTGTTSFSFSPVGSTVRMVPAANAWTGATKSTIEPAPGVDGRAFISYKVTNPSAGVWHYEYAIHNQNLDRSIQSFSVPLGCGITVSNLGFHAPPNHPGFPNDGTVGNTGFSNAAWTSNQSSDALSWNTETLAQNPNANAIRFGTLYNFRFDSDRPPQAVNATVGFFKIGTPIMVPIEGPSSPCTPLQLASAASRKTHGIAGDFDIDLPLTGEPGVECRASDGNHTLVVTLSNPPVSGNATVTSGTGSVAGSPTFNGNTMTVPLTGIADVQKITVTLSNVTDSFAQVMPDTPVSVNMLIGDANASKTVNATDIGQAKAQSGLPVTGANFHSDVNASGTMTASDVGQVKASAGNTLP